MDVVFLDSNVLFSAAHRSDSGLQRLWHLTDVELLTSGYAAEEARRNLESPERLKRLDGLLNELKIVGEATDVPLPDDVRLPGKDRPILQAAVAAGATHLLTGDLTHFGPLFFTSVHEVKILPPGPYLRKGDD